MRRVILDLDTKATVALLNGKHLSRAYLFILASCAQEGSPAIFLTAQQLAYSLGLSESDASDALNRLEALELLVLGIGESVELTKVSVITDSAEQLAEASC